MFGATLSWTQHNGSVSLDTIIKSDNPVQLYAPDKTTK